MIENASDAMTTPLISKFLKSCLRTVLVASVCGGLANAGTDHSGKPTAPLPTVVDGPDNVVVPDDTLFVRHNPGRSPLIFLVSLSPTGKVQDAKPIAGFSLYIDAAKAQIEQSTFAANLAGREFVLRLPDPLSKYTHLGRQSEPCRSTDGLRTLYERGINLWRSPVDDEGALQCYNYILDRNPLSVAARYGLAVICRSRMETCEEQYLRSLAETTPNFEEARVDLAKKVCREGGCREGLEALEEILRLDLPLARRSLDLATEARWLESGGRANDEVSAIRRWVAVESQLLLVYPEIAIDSMGMDGGLLEESMGLLEDASNSYRLVVAMSPPARGQSGIPHYAAALGLARVLRKSGEVAEADAICSDWSKKWRGLVTHQMFIAKWDVRQEGAGEVGGRWEFSCGSPEHGRELIEASAKKYPTSDAPYRVLAQYYYSVGNIAKAREAEATADRLRREWSKRLGEFF